MTEANLFQQYAKEAMRSASKSQVRMRRGTLSTLPTHGRGPRWRAKGYWGQASLRRRATLL
jgi:hypothetical protein